MKSSLYLGLALTLTLAACTNKPAGRENANPDADSYAELKTEKDWREFISDRESDLSSLCRESNRYYSYDYSACFADGNATPKSLNERQAAWKRYIGALKAASVSGKFTKGRMESFREKAEQVEKSGKYFAEGFKRVQERRAKQDKIIAELSKTSCKVTRNDSLSQELTVSDCDPARTQNPDQVVKLLNKLAEVSVRTDAGTIANTSDKIRRLTPKYKELAQLKESLLNSGLFAVAGDQLIVNGAGNPFFGTKELSGLITYGQIADQISELTVPSSKCAEPCDRAIYKMSAALNFNPIKVFCDSRSDRYGSNSPDPTFLKTWYTTNDSRQLANLGLTYSAQDRSLYGERNSSGDRLTYSDILREQNIVISLPYTRLSTICPEPAPYFFFFQESEAVAKYLRAMDTEAARNVREIRWYDAGTSQPLLVRVNRDASSRLILEMPYIETARRGQSLTQIRDQVYAQIPGVLAGVR